MSITSDQTVEVLRAAGAELRALRILALLAREELAVLELTRILGQSQPPCLAAPEGAGRAELFDGFPDGAWVFYRLAGGGGGGATRDLLDKALSLISDQ